MHDRRGNPAVSGSSYSQRAALLSATAFLLLPSAVFAAPPLTVLTVGGGPSYSYNQVAIEGNVRYVSNLLPAGVPQTILFTSGDPTDKNVQFSADGPQLTREERAFRVLFRQSQDTSLIRYRAPQIPKIAGPSQHAAFTKAMTSLANPSDTSPLMLYFTGHGSPNQDNPENNNYNLWGEDGLTVQELSKEVARLPKDRPLTLVMVQCFSGSFGNLLFNGGDPNGDLLNRPFCGFFATTKDRVAAGCTPELNEKNYRDFTSFFFAALTGRTRLGGKVAPPDYNKDGIVGMDEAFCYSILTSPSIDVPVATSDVFLRRFVTASDDLITTTPYEHIRSIASPAQRAALDGLSRSLANETPDRLKNALAIVMEQQASPRPQRRPQIVNPQGTPQTLPPANTPIGVLARLRKQMEEQFSGLGNGIANPQFAQARESALGYLRENPTVEKQVFDAQDALISAMRASRPASAGGGKQAPVVERADREVLALRFARLAKSIVLEERLRMSGDTARIAQFDRLKKLESGNPFRNL